jgi:DNA anti-recombination protein RmuC
MLELEKAKVDAIKWKRVAKDNKGKIKEEVSQELEQQLQLMQEKFQIMTMQKVDYSQKLKVENQKLQQQLSKVKRDLHEKNEQVEIMQETIKTIAKVSEEMLECRPPAPEHIHYS